MLVWPATFQLIKTHHVIFYRAPEIFIEKVLKKGDAGVRQAWREKVALCTISFLMCVFLGFFTFFFQSTSCPPPSGSLIKWSDAKKPGDFAAGRIAIFGNVYDAKDWFIKNHPPISGVQLKDVFQDGGPIDLSKMFTSSAPSCTTKPKQACSFGNGVRIKTQYCHDWEKASQKLAPFRVGSIYFGWEDLPSTTFMGFNGYALDLDPYMSAASPVFGEREDEFIRKCIGQDCSLTLGRNTNNLQLGNCLKELYSVGTIEQDPIMCIATNVILNIALVMICALVVVRFVLAVIFGWFLSWQLGKIQATRSLFSRRPDLPEPEAGTGVTCATHPQQFSLFHKINFEDRYRELYTMCVVTAYSEDEAGLKTTMDSLTMTDYHDHYKMIFVVADGIVQGSGNPKPTGDIVLDMLELDEAMHGPIEYENVVDPKTNKEKKVLKCRNAEPQSYVAIGTGAKKHNMARVYCGYYNTEGRKVAVLLVYKCGTPAEKDSAKPGNRGKRDSQIVLMDFLSKITFDEKLSPFQFDLFMKWSHIMTVRNGGKRKVTPDMFEIVLMVDADTRVLPDSLSRLVSVMQRDPSVMGLCGETRIMNKNESWVSMIQVFEYYTSHHLAKSFESIFGGVTCLPGCFCMYRIKAPKPLPPEMRSVPNPEEKCNWVPIISNPDIVADYSESVVDTLHRKNLLLLGEDRFLTTLMLRTFPKRKMMFVPKALCKTQVPAKFEVLLSQRRRWINSTIHNLMELVLVRELCGTFCFSMQFVVFLELVGTATLPAAIIFTLVMVTRSAIGTPEWVPLGLLGGILGLPAVLIVLTTRQMIYIFYMLVYLVALPVWNFVLPVYAFWHFDDFSWGQTRQVAGEKKGGDAHGHGGGEGEKDPEAEIPKKLWAEWEVERRKKVKDAGLSDPWGRVTIDTDTTTIKRKKRKSVISRLFSGSDKTSTTAPVPTESDNANMPAKSASLRIDTTKDKAVNQTGGKSSAVAVTISPAEQRGGDKKSATLQRKPKTPKADDAKKK